MNSGRAALLLRRLSTGDNRLKNFNLNQNATKDSVLVSPVSGSKELGLPKRASTSNFSVTPITQVKRSYSDHIIKMSASGTEPNPNDKVKHTNHLIKEKSPYLLQHAHNPVDWYPWCEEAIEKAKEENKLIFLSVGYSTCHWCHVMEKESFENESVAQVMNENFINIKVDREERPDIDRVYMLFIMATTGGGGWPMSVFLTPDLHPITGGTYFPPEDHWGRPGFKTILLSLAKKWKENQSQLMEAGTSILQALQGLSLSDTQTDQPIPGEETWMKGVRRLISIYESEFGGFGIAPKFPQVSILNFLFHYYARDKSDEEGMKCLDMCLYTLTKMAKGGIYDHLGGGFARYSVDNDWHVPHFEKMLYDQAQLIVAYSDAFLATKNEFYADVVRDIIKYCNRDLRHTSGGYYSAEDADSYPTSQSTHKKEGAFYVWDYTELESLLGDKKLHSASCFDVFCDYFSVEQEGNISPESDPHEELTGKNVFIIYGSKEKTSQKFGLTIKQLEDIISDCTVTLFENRNMRPRPEIDTKMICSWNGLMIAGLSQAAQSLGEKQFVEEAIKTANFVKDNLYEPDSGLLIHSCYKGGDGNITQIDKPIKGFLDDYAFLIKGLLDLYEASLDVEWLNWARQLQAKQNELFWDSSIGGYYSCSADDQTVVMRLKEENDGAEPSGNSVSCHNLLRLAIYPNVSKTETIKPDKEMAKNLLMAFSKRLIETPTALPEMISALMFYHDSPTQVLIAGGPADPRTLELVRVVRSKLLPGRVLTVADPTESSNGDLLSNRIRCVGGVPTAYVCRRFACSLPVTDVKQLDTLLDEPHVACPTTTK